MSFPIRCSAFSQAGAEQKARALLVDLLDEFDLRDEILLLVDDIQTGPGGSLLPILVRERVALARALVKRPDILICNQALASLPAEERGNIVPKLRELLPSTTLIWMDSEVPADGEFDHVFEIEDGRFRTGLDDTQHDDVLAAPTRKVEHDEARRGVGENGFGQVGDGRYPISRSPISREMRQTDSSARARCSSQLLRNADLPTPGRAPTTINVPLPHLIFSQGDGISAIDVP